MKKLIQIVLILTLVFVLLQAAAPGSMPSASQTGSNVVSSLHLTEQQTNTANIHAEACLVRIKQVICVRPNVGWNT